MKRDISAQQTPDIWNLTDTAPVLETYADQDFDTSDNTRVLAGDVNLGTLCRRDVCSVAAGVLSIPVIGNIDTTEDSPDNQTATYSTYLRASGQQPIPWLLNYRIPVSTVTPASAIDWTTLRVHKGGIIQRSPLDTYNKQEILALIEQQINTALGTLNDASASVKGRTFLTTNPAAAVTPLAIGKNDLRTTPAITDSEFGAVAGGTNNDAAFLLAVADPHKRIQVPAGDYTLTLSANQIAGKAWYGPGRFLQSGSYIPGTFRYWITTPTPYTGIDHFSGDQSLTEPEQWIIGPNVRSADSAVNPLTQSYFEPTITPHYDLFTNYGGHSGATCLLTDAAIGAVSSVTVNSVANLAIGQQIAFAPVSTGLLENTRTITNIVGSVVSFTPALPGPTDYPIGSIVSTGQRAMHPYMWIDHVHAGHGDGYGILVRSVVSGTAQAGQTHPYLVATGGMIGGDAHLTHDKLYWTTLEHNVYDDGNDVQAVAYIQTFNRTNATKAYEWGGLFFNSAGSQNVDYGFSLDGKFTVGLDTVLADSSIKPLNMKLGQRIVFDSLPDPAKLYTNWGGLIGDTSIGQEAGGDWTFIHNGVTAMRSASATGLVTFPVGLSALKLGTGATLNKFLSGSGSHDWATVAANSTASFDITVTGAVVGDLCVLGTAFNSSVIFTCAVRATNTVTVYATNPTAGGVVVGAVAHKVMVIQ